MNNCISINEYTLIFVSCLRGFLTKCFVFNKIYISLQSLRQRLCN